MRDLVEHTISQVLNKQPTMKGGQKPFQVSDVKDKELWSACCQFEAIFLQQMMSAMRKTVPESTLTPPSYASSMYDGMLDQAISESGSKQAPLGLAINMYRQLEQNGSSHASTIQEIQKASDNVRDTGLSYPDNKGGI